MLSRRRRKDEDEAAALQGQRSYGIPDDDGVCGPGGGDRKGDAFCFPRNYPGSSVDRLRVFL